MKRSTLRSEADFKAKHIKLFNELLQWSLENNVNLDDFDFYEAVALKDGSLSFASWYPVGFNMKSLYEENRPGYKWICMEIDQDDKTTSLTLVHE